VLNIYFLSLRIFEQLALALKTVFVLKFFKPWACPPKKNPTRTQTKSLMQHSNRRDFPPLIGINKTSSSFTASCMRKSPTWSSNPLQQFKLALII